MNKAEYKRMLEEYAKVANTADRSVLADCFALGDLSEWHYRQVNDENPTTLAESSRVLSGDLLNLNVTKRQSTIMNARQICHVLTTFQRRLILEHCVPIHAVRDYYAVADKKERARRFQLLGKYGFIAKKYAKIEQKTTLVMRHSELTPSADRILESHRIITVDLRKDSDEIETKLTSIMSQVPLDVSRRALKRAEQARSGRAEERDGLKMEARRIRVKEVDGIITMAG